MKIIAQTFVLLIALLILPSVLLGQAKSITKEAYNSALNEAEAKTEKQIRKRVSIQKIYGNGEVLTTLTSTSEYLPPDKSRWLAVEDRGYMIKRIEVFTIGNFEYRKEDNGAWVKRERFDGESYGLSGGAGIDDSTREYFIEEAKIGKEKFQVLIEKQVDAGKTSFNESKTWINKKGFISKKTSTNSSIEFKNINSSIEITYDYNIKPPKIEAPIK
jgi:hypothetical protein